MDKDDLRLIQARWVLGHINSDQLPGIAVEALEAGFDTPALRVLAGVSNPVMSELGPQMERAFAELGLERFEREAAGDVISLSWARAIVAGDVAPYEGAKAIWTEVCDPLDGGRDLFVFKSLASEHEDYLFARPGNPEGYDLKLRECEETIVKEAQALISRADGPNGPQQ